MENKLKFFQKTNQNNQNSKTAEPDNAFDMLYKLQNLLKEEIVIKERCMIFHIKKYDLFS